MTVEQKAEEWIKDHSGLIGSYKFVKYDYDSMQKAFIDGYHKCEKEHEWHKVLDGDLPKDSEVKLCYTRTAKYVCASYDEKYDCWGFVFNNLEHCIPSSVIIAWKEIVLPKEME